MAGLCKGTIIGNLGRDPETRYTSGGTPSTKFSVACSRSYTVDGERREETQWFTVITWGKLAELCKDMANKGWLVKGQRVYAEGRLQTRTWEGNDGQKRTEVEIVATDVLLLGGKRDDGERPQLGEGQTADEVPW
jgi:single-strand DNA-binding protein